MIIITIQLLPTFDFTDNSGGIVKELRIAVSESKLLSFLVFG